MCELVFHILYLDTSRPRNKSSLMLLQIHPINVYNVCMYKLKIFQNLIPIFLISVLMVDNAWKNVIEETQVVVTRGAPLSLPCKAPDPRAAVQARREYSNVLDISKNYGQPASDYESRINYENQRSQKAEKNTDFVNRRNPYHSLPIDDDDDDEQIDNANEDDASRQMENGELYANDDVSDSSVSDFVKRKNGSNKRKFNKKLDKKQLDSDSKRFLKPFQTKSVEDNLDSRVTYRWFHNDTELPSNDTRYSILENGTLHFKRFGFKKIGNQDIGKYRCIAVGANGSMISTAVSLAFACENIYLSMMD